MVQVDRKEIAKWTELPVQQTGVDRKEFKFKNRNPRLG